MTNDQCQMINDQCLFTTPPAPAACSCHLRPISTVPSIACCHVWMRLINLGLPRLAGAEERRPVKHILLEAFEIQINHRCDVERDELGNHETAHDHEAQRTSR